MEAYNVFVRGEPFEVHLTNAHGIMSDTKRAALHLGFGGELAYCAKIEDDRALPTLPLNDSHLGPDRCQLAAG